MSSILWLASYPRSGNTWLRAFLASCRTIPHEMRLNRLEAMHIASDRNLIDDTLGLDSACLTDVELREYLPIVYRTVAQRHVAGITLKIHDAYGHTRSGDPLFPPRASRGFIHIVRNPFDVAVSLSHYSGRSIDSVIDAMADEFYTQGISHDGLRSQRPQQLRSWSGHATSWLRAAEEIPALRVRYEDMLANPLKSFSDIANFAGVDGDAAHIAAAVDATGFARLQAQETQSGFAERPHATKVFFRNGQAGSWRQSLTHAQSRRLIDRHAPMMLRLGYLAPGGEITDNGGNVEGASA
jgi:aryl sulfotransferase